MSDRQAAEAALRLAAAQLPHLSGLAHHVRLQAETRVNSAAIFASGRLVYNPTWLLGLTLPEAAFVMAHELMHLALRTHERGASSAAHLVNVAHDWIINDILRTELRMEIPAGGLDRKYARYSSLEKLVAELKSRGLQRGEIHGGWGAFVLEGPDPSAPALGAALSRHLGLAEPASARSGSLDDVLTREREELWYPGEAHLVPQRIRETARAAARAAASSQLRTLLAARGESPGSSSAMVMADTNQPQPPWALVLQSWLDACTPGARTYLRPSRRGDVGLAGRRREGWTLHIILDSSGSMQSEFSRVLGALASFCEGVNVERVRIVQCDAAVTTDEWVETSQLAAYLVQGYGGSDLRPAIQRLAEDPTVEACLILTDGDVEIPQEAPPFEVLWGLVSEGFTAPYGQAVLLAP